MEIKFVDEPPRNRGSQKYQTLLAEMTEELKNHPNQWAEFPIQISSAANASGFREKYPEFSFRTIGGNFLPINHPNKKLWILYIRYDKPENN
jgi:hypothetical protein